ncbi:hypothetical protein CRM22_002856 [Opisthorchis felineus]|uniref:Uncharacterized protein n=1 Tax=Opisthorchis felineus TaxID=147828 RepID=A0A4S2M443_OPIFE|nr:hypothetical protein CRM22_002856 [Opisthorchis felineus]
MNGHIKIQAYAQMTVHTVEEDKRGQQELSRQEDLRTKNAAANNNASNISVACNQLASVTQLNGSSQRISSTTSMEIEESTAMGPGVVDSSSLKAPVHSSHHQRSSSPSLRRRRKPSAKHESRSHHDESRHRHRRRSSRTPSSSSSSTHAATKHRKSQNIHRSRTAESGERVSIKRPPDSDWRKDLMAGRRRSPPEMPENSYYGYEKHKSRKRSRDRYRINERESVYDRPNLGFDDNRERRSEALVHHHSPQGEGSKPKHRLHRKENLRTDHIVDDEKRHRKARHKYWDPANSDSNRMVTGECSVGEMRLNDDNRRYKVACAKEKFPEMNDKIKEQKYPLSPHSAQKRRWSPSPEGPTLPPELSKTRMPVTFSKRRTSSPSSSPSESEESEGSGSSSGNSSSDSGSGSSSSSCSDSTSEEEEEEAVPIPEGPPLPPSHSPAREPEGPSLPPTLPAPEWTKFPKGEAASPSDSSSSASGNSCEDGCSSGVSVSGSSSDSSSSEESQQEECQRVDTSYPSDCLRTTEGPALPPNAIETWRSHSKHEQSCDFQRSHGDHKEETAEEALRRRALASLMRASVHRRRARSPS